MCQICPCKAILNRRKASYEQWKCNSQLNHLTLAVYLPLFTVVIFFQFGKEMWFGLATVVLHWQDFLNENWSNKCFLAERRLGLWIYSHPMDMNIARKGIELDTRCAVCHRYFEDGGHLFFRCHEVKRRRRALLLENVRMNLAECVHAIDVLTTTILTLPVDQKMNTVCLLWSCGQRV